MSSLIDTLALMRDSIHALTGTPPAKIHLGREVKLALYADVDATALFDHDMGVQRFLGMEIVDVSNDPYALAIVQHQAQQVLPL